MFANIMSD